MGASERSDFYQMMIYIIELGKYYHKQPTSTHLAENVLNHNFLVLNANVR
jgi:hypothetical protein